MATWRGGGHIEPSVAPRSAVNSLVALVSGGPVGFEAALTGLLGGTATWVGHRITVVGHLIRQASGAEEVGPVRGTVSRLPYWLAGLSGLLTYHWLPFGKVDLGFRFEHFDGRLGVGEGLAVFAFAVLVVVPAVWAVFVIGRAERATVFRRNPILVAMAGGLLFALLAVPNDLVLFSGQQGIQLLPEVGAADLAYVAVAKWLALVVALFAGWRGGPIFPTFTSVAALAVLVDEVVGVGPDLLMIAGIAAVSVVFVRGSIPVALVLTLYAAPLSYAIVILVACVGAAAALAVARPLALLPAPPEESSPAEA